jgi:hypothetical protein
VVQSGPPLVQRWRQTFIQRHDDYRSPGPLGSLGHDRGPGKTSDGDDLREDTPHELGRPWMGRLPTVVREPLRLRNHGLCLVHYHFPVYANGARVPLWLPNQHWKVTAVG